MSLREFPMLAAGHNNADNLNCLHLLDSTKCHFQQYKEYIEVEFHNEESREQTAANRYKPIGLPFCIWRFPALTQGELQLFRTTYCTGLDSLVTVRVFNPKKNQWKTYNAILSLNEDLHENWNGYEWRNIEFTFRNMRVIN